jgi:hypothetical protein
MHIEDTHSVPPSEKYIKDAEIQRIAEHYHVSGEDAEEHLSMIEEQKRLTLDLLQKKRASLN